MRQQVLALHLYHDGNRRFPFGDDQLSRTHHSWVTHILPFLEQHALAAQIDRSVVWNAPVNRQAVERVLPVMRCPTSILEFNGNTDYAGIVGSLLASPAATQNLNWNNGVLIRSTRSATSPISMAGILDDTSNTICISEASDRPPEYNGFWADGRSAITHDIGPVNYFNHSSIYSLHRGGAYVALSDGAIRGEKQLSVAAVQVDPNFADSVERMQQLSRSLDRPVDLICWPESALGYYDESLDHFRDLIRTYTLSERPNSAGDPTNGLNVPLLAGANTYTEGGRDTGPYLNMGFLIEPNKSFVGRYTKRTLMPIGEYFPGEDWLPAVRDWAAIDRVRRRGTSAAPLEHPNGTRLGVLICYEDMSRENCRSTVAAGADCLVALINASGFQSRYTLEQHMRLAQLRAVENRRSFVRCAATGVTCFVDPTGRIVSRVDTGGDKVLVATVPLFEHQTIYTRYGEWFSWLCILLVAGAAFPVAAARGRRRTNQGIRQPQEN